MSYLCRTFDTNLIVDTKKICPMFQGRVEGLTYIPLALSLPHIDTH